MCKTNRTAAMTGGAFSDQLAKLAAMPARLAEIAREIPAAQRKTLAGNGAFSLTEHACHLRDIEIEAFRVRLERILAETSPALPDVDGAALARARDYHRQDLGKALAAFAAVRADLTHRLASLTPTERQRTGVMEGVGAITIEGLVAKMLEHDGEHHAELEQLRRELGG
jgi:hypothetical protein